ncbi:uncharacterized protein TNCV_2224141 [Trichonephila clavipes]|nr:uncharacterized protein TNCV_2224141 [Trichonephila clavipes]
MDRFTTAELADMHLMYGAAQGNGAAAERLYRERFLGRKKTSGSLNIRTHSQGVTHGWNVLCFKAWNWHRKISQNSFIGTKNTDSTTVHNNPLTSSRAVGRALSMSLQAITPDDYPRRLNFATWYLQQTSENQTFPANALFTDEATFMRSGMFKMHNSHLWDHVNPHGTITHAYQERFSINVWAGIVHNNLVGPYILPSRLTGTYNIFLQEVLPELLVDVPLSVRNRMWFQHDGTPAHFSRNVRNHLDTVYGQHWIGRGGPVLWPPQDLVARLSVAAGHVIDMPDVFSDLSRSMRRRCECCVTVGGRTFEHLL